MIGVLTEIRVARYARPIPSKVAPLGMFVNSKGKRKQNNSDLKEPQEAEYVGASMASGRLIRARMSSCSVRICGARGKAERLNQFRHKLWAQIEARARGPILPIGTHEP